LTRAKSLRVRRNRIFVPILLEGKRNQFYPSHYFLRDKASLGCSDSVVNLQSCANSMKCTVRALWLNREILYIKMSCIFAFRMLIISVQITFWSKKKTDLFRNFLQTLWVTFEKKVSDRTQIKSLAAKPSRNEHLFCIYKKRANIQKTKPGFSGFSGFQGGQPPNFFPARFARRIFPSSRDPKTWIYWISGEETSKLGVLVSFSGKKTSELGVLVMFPAKSSELGVLVSGNLRLDFWKLICI